MMDPQSSAGETFVPQEKVEVEQETLEARIRKARPPPRVRISSTSQPGFVSLRLEGVAVTFRNQEVIKDATWDVKTGDRIGLVGPNGGWLRKCREEIYILKSYSNGGHGCRYDIAHSSHVPSCVYPDVFPRIRRGQDHTGQNFGR